jgi:hypothetical protein
MGEAHVVIDDIDPSIKIRTRHDHASDVVVAGHVGADRIGCAVFLADDFDGLHLYTICGALSSSIRARVSKTGAIVPV